MKPRFLIIGTELIGLCYAQLLSFTYQVDVYATNNQSVNRFDHVDTGAKKSPHYQLINSISSIDYYDYIWVNVPIQEVEDILCRLRNFNTKNIILSNPGTGDYHRLHRICGRKNLIFLSPSLFATKKQEIICYGSFPAFFRRTTLGTLDELQPKKVLMDLKECFKTSGIPTHLSNKIESVIKSYFALTLPIAITLQQQQVTLGTLFNQKNLLDACILSIKENLDALDHANIGVVPLSLRVFQVSNYSISRQLLQWLYHRGLTEALLKQYPFTKGDNTDQYRDGFMSEMKKNGVILHHLCE